MSDKARQGLTVLATLVTIAVNAAANALPLNGQTTGDISDSFDVFFVPAGYVFSIWGVIYAGLLAYTVFQALPAQRGNARLRAIAPWYWLSSVANSVWIFLWHYEQFPLTIVAMLALLLSLIAIYSTLGIGRGESEGVARWAVNFPFSIYLGWISVATIANATTLLDWLGWQGGPLSPQAWALVMLAVGVGLAAWMAQSRHDAAYLAVLVWAFAGIAVKQADAPLVASGAWVAAGLVALLLLLASFRWAPNPRAALPA